MQLIYMEQVTISAAGGDKTVRETCRGPGIISGVGTDETAPAIFKAREITLVEDGGKTVLGTGKVQVTILEGVIGETAPATFKAREITLVEDGGKTVLGTGKVQVTILEGVGGKDNALRNF